MNKRAFSMVVVAVAMAISISLALLAMIITRQSNERNGMALIAARSGRIELSTEMPTWTVVTADTHAGVGLGSPRRRRAWAFDGPEKGYPVLVDVSHFDMDEEVVSAVSAMPRLEGVVMRGAKITREQYLRFIRDHAALRCLDLTGANLSIEEIEEGIKLSRLHYVAISSDVWKSPRSMLDRDGQECEVLVTAAD